MFEILEYFQFSGPQFIYQVMHSFKYGGYRPHTPSKCLLGLFLLFLSFFLDRQAVYLNSNSRHAQRNTTGDR